MSEEDSTVTLLVRQCIRLKGDASADEKLYVYGPSLCLWCKRPVPVEGQEAGTAVATARGIVFRIKIGCRCGSLTARVCIDLDEDDAA